MVELVDTADLKFAAPMGIRVRVPVGEPPEPHMWKIQLLGATEDQWLNIIKDAAEVKNMQHVELSVIHTSFQHGQQSFGWSCEAKIILPELNPGTRRQRRLQYRQALLMVEAFNDVYLRP